MSGVVDEVLTANAWLVYTLVAALVFSEAALFVGFVIPGETAAVLGGVSASRGHVDVVAMCAVVVVAAVLGDTVGYGVGSRYGQRVLTAGPLQRHQGRLADAQALLARRGGVAVFLARFVAFFRAVMPALAGASRMPYRTFLPFNALGGLLWGVAFVLLGYLAGASYAAVEQAVGRGLALLVLVVALGGLVVWRVRRSRRAREGEASPAE